MARASAALALVVAVVAGLLLVSGGSDADPRTPAGLPGLPVPFLGAAVIGEGGLTAAIDSYGDVVDLRRSPAGPALLTVPSARQVVGTVTPAMAIVPRLRLGDGRSLPLWRADAVTQRYRPGTNVLVTTARFGPLRASVTYAAGAAGLACVTRVRGGRARVRVVAGGALPDAARLHCNSPWDRAAIDSAIRSDRRWLSASAPLGAEAPAWAVAMYQRSLLVLRALTDRRSGAVAAGARDGWAYVWPRDAATAVLAFEAAGHEHEARRTARFLARLDLSAAARFHGDGSPVPGRAAQGDAAGWVAVATEAATAAVSAKNARAAGVGVRPSTWASHRRTWRGQADYQEKAPGDYLGNAIATTAADSPAQQRMAAAAIDRAFAGPDGLDRVAGDRGSGLDSAAAWAVRPFALPRLYPAAGATLRSLLPRGGRFGIVPSVDWPQRDPWTAPTAWSAWAFAALAHADARARRTGPANADRRDALHLLADLRRAATPAGALPERVDAHTGIPRSTTPLAWSHAFTILALLELWPATR
jgi:hypothetical protein